MTLHGGQRIPSFRADGDIVPDFRADGVLSGVPDPGEEFLAVKGLGQVVVSSAVQAVDFGFDIIPCR